MSLPISRRTLLIIIVILLALAVPLTLFLVSQQQDIRQRAATPDTSVLATFDGQPVTEQEVRSFADQTYKTAPTDPAELKTSLDELIERKILDKVVQENNLQISDQEITDQLATEGLLDLANDPTIRENARISVIKRKIEQRFTKTREAYTVGFWLTPPNYGGVSLTQEQQSLLTQQKANTPSALAEILTGMQNGDEPLALARRVAAKYPSLETVMSVNGFIIQTTENEKLLMQPLLYSFQQGRANLAFFKTLFTLSANQVTLVEDPQTSAGGVVIKVVGATDGPFDNYSDWLADQKAKRVVMQ